MNLFSRSSFFHERAAYPVRLTFAAVLPVALDEAGRRDDRQMTGMIGKEKWEADRPTKRARLEK